MAFTLVDIDGDGQVSKNDLIRYLELITAAPEGVKIDLVSDEARGGGGHCGIHVCLAFVENVGVFAGSAVILSPNNSAGKLA